MADDTIPPRIATLEQIARSTETALGDIRTDLRGLRSDLTSEIIGVRGQTQVEVTGVRGDMRDMRADMRSQFRWLLGIIIAVLIAQAALWQQVGHLQGQMAAISVQLGDIATLLRQRAGG
jgi:hypothetical protein